MVVKSDTGPCVEYRGVIVSIEIGGDDFILGVSNYTYFNLVGETNRRAFYIPFSSPSEAFLIASLICS